jgi:hypothetical protein
MIDTPAELIIYLSILGYTITKPGTLPEPEMTLAFQDSDVLDLPCLDHRLHQLKSALLPYCHHPEVWVIQRLMDALRAHCASGVGIDVGVESPFARPDTVHALARFEDLLKTTHHYPRKEQK